MTGERWTKRRKKPLPVNLTRSARRFLLADETISTFELSLIQLAV